MSDVSADCFEAGCRSDDELADVKGEESPDVVSSCSVAKAGVVDDDSAVGSLRCVSDVVSDSVSL